MDTGREQQRREKFKKFDRPFEPRGITSEYWCEEEMENKKERRRSPMAYATVLFLTLPFADFALFILKLHKTWPRFPRSRILSSIKLHFFPLIYFKHTANSFSTSFLYRFLSYILLSSVVLLFFRKRVYKCLENTSFSSNAGYKATTGSYYTIESNKALKFFCYFRKQYFKHNSINEKITLMLSQPQISFILAIIIILRIACTN